MNLIKKSRLCLIVLTLLLTVLLTSCNSNSSSNFDTNLTTKNLPTGWSITDAGLAYDGGCFYITEDILTNQDFRYTTDVRSCTNRLKPFYYFGNYSNPIK